MSKVSKTDADYVQKILHMAKDGVLPHDFDAWEVCDSTGWTVAHAAARGGTLPNSFSQWKLSTKYGWSVAHEAAQRGYLPDGFTQWGISDNKRVTVAHTAAKAGRLPDSFSDWELSDDNGTTVAHIAAVRNKNLPADFPWHLEDSYGWSVLGEAIEMGMIPAGFDAWDTVVSSEGHIAAHIAASHGTLPVDFDQWSIINKKGESVLKSYVIGENDRENDVCKRWENEPPKCRNVSDWTVFKEVLPEIYMKYTLNNVFAESNVDRGVTFL
jgi:hypothetical protein